MKQIHAAISGGISTVDDEMYDELMKHRWYVRAGINSKDKLYFVRMENHKGRTVNFYMHREVMKFHLKRSLSSLEIIDHIDGNPFNNQVTNLRISTMGENLHNRPSCKGSSSKYHGVSKYGEHQWHVRIQKDEEDIYVGMFKTETEAAKHFDMEAILLYGDKAYLNFPSKRTEYIKRLDSGEDPITIKHIDPTSEYEGVAWNKNEKRWVAYVNINKKRKHLGTFDTEEEAHETRLKAEEYLRTSIGPNPIPEDKIKTSQYEGVTFRKDIGKGRWQAYVKIDGKRKYLLGTFATEIEAFEARKNYQ